MEALVRKHLGDFGRYQAFIYLMVSIPSFLAGCQALVFSWTGYSRDIRCRIPYLDDNVTSSYGWSLPPSLMEQWYPPNSVNEAGNTAFCKYCPDNSDFGGRCNETDTVGCDNGYVFDTSIMETTLAEDFDLHCDYLWRKDVTRILYMVGNLVGAVLFGVLGDKVGRRPVMLGCAFAQILVYNLAFFADNFYVYVAYQFTSGALQDGTYIAGFVVFTELVGGGWARTICGIWYQSFFTVGELWVGAAAFAFRRHRPVQLAAGILSLLCIPYYWMFPESIRWLVVKGKLKEAKEALNVAVRFNGRPPVSDSAFEQAAVRLTRVTYGAIGLEEINEQTLAAKTWHTEGRKADSLLGLFRKRSLAKNSVIIFFTWYSVSLCYYGLTFNTSELGQDPFVSYLLLTLFEIPGLFVCIPIMEYVGRKPALVSLLGLGGLCCIGTSITTAIGANHWVTLCLALLGKMSVSAAFAVLYNVSIEVFPTVVRNVGTGMGSFFARLGSVSAPATHLLLKPLGSWVPFFVYGLLPFIAAIMDLFLPETKNKPIPETIQDAA